MPLSHAHVCAREIASDEYHRLRELKLLNPDFKPRPYGELIAIPVKTGDLELEFEAFLLVNISMQTNVPLLNQLHVYSL